MSPSPVCPCDVFIHPLRIFNPPGRDTILYRPGDYLSFRHALLLSRAGETELANWKPNAQGDLAVQMIEWWAYIADILTFYNERIASNSYLRTAELPEDVNRLIRLLSYRPRPGIGATGAVAALMNSNKPFIIPAGFQIQSKPGPGKTPQMFEVDKDTPVAQPDAIDADPVPDNRLLNGGVLLKGSVNKVKKDDSLLLVNSSAPQSAIVTVTDVKEEKDPRGQKNTRVVLSGTSTIQASTPFTGWRLLKTERFARLWPYPTDAAHPVVGANSVVLDSIYRDIRAGDPLVFQLQGASLTAALVTVTSYSEAVWFANGASNNPTTPPGIPTPPIPILHSVIGFSAIPPGSWPISTTILRFAWEDVGELIGTPQSTFNGSTPQLTIGPSTLQPSTNYPVQIEDANGNGEAAVVTNPTTLAITGLPDVPPILTPPLRLLFNLVKVSRGQTVRNEILGSGDATAVRQEFTLQKSPLTYLFDPTSTSGNNYKSTLRVWVDELEWKEAASFYGQAADARIFVTREDDAQKTHVQFGDGVQGARLPSGANNVKATYRFGSGAEAPDAGSLTVIAHPLPGLKSIRNPVAAGGGADPDPVQQIRRYAPRSVLTFGRAVSGDDYETIAAQAPGVARARAYFSFDPPSQRTIARIYVGDNSAARDAAITALTGAVDPNRPFSVTQAAPIPVQLSLSVVVDPARQPETVEAAVRVALLDPDSGLFGTNVVRIGKSFFASEIYEACLSVPGVLAVHALEFRTDPSRNGDFQLRTGFRFDTGEGNFFQLQTDQLDVSWEAPDYAG